MLPRRLNSFRSSLPTNHKYIFCFCPVGLGDQTYSPQEDRNDHDYPKPDDSKTRTSRASSSALKRSEVGVVWGIRCRPPRREVRDCSERGLQVEGPSNSYTYSDVQPGLRVPSPTPGLVWCKTRGDSGDHGWAGPGRNEVDSRHTLFDLTRTDTPGPLKTLPEVLRTYLSLDWEWPFTFVLLEHRLLPGDEPRTTFGEGRHRK